MTINSLEPVAAALPQGQKSLKKRAVSHLLQNGSLSKRDKSKIEVTWSPRSRIHPRKPGFEECETPVGVKAHPQAPPVSLPTLPIRETANPPVRQNLRLRSRSATRLTAEQWLSYKRRQAQERLDTAPSLYAAPPLAGALVSARDPVTTTAVPPEVKPIALRQLHVVTPPVEPLIRSVPPPGIMDAEHHMLPFGPTDSAVKWSKKSAPFETTQEVLDGKRLAYSAVFDPVTSHGTKRPAASSPTSSSTATSSYQKRGKWANILVYKGSETSQPLKRSSGRRPKQCTPQWSDP